MTFTWRTPALALVLGASAVASPGPVTAQEAPGTTTWSVKPTPVPDRPDRPNFSFTARPGTEIRDSLRVRNFVADPVELRVYARDAFTTRNGSLDLLTEDQASRDVGTWIAMSASTVVVPGNGFVDVPFTVQIPANATPGDHSGGVVTSVRSTAVGEGRDPVRLDRRLGSRVSLRVDGPINAALELTGLDATFSGGWNPIGRGTVRLTYGVKNTGNIRLKARPEVEVRGVLGLGGTTVTLPDMPELLPGDSLEIPASVDVYPAGRLSVSLTLRPFSATEGEVLAPPPAEVSRSASTLAIPWASLVFLGGLIAIALLITRIRRRNQRILDERVHAALEAAGTRTP